MGNSTLDAAQTKRQEMIWLRNEFLEVAFDPTSGALVCLSNRLTGWKIIARAELGLAFAMLVPVPDQLNHRTAASRQRLSSYELDKDGQQLVLVWDMPLWESGGQFDATFKGIITLNAMGLQFDGEVINRSKMTIDNVAWPILGELAPLDGHLELFTAAWSGAQRTQLWPSFRNEQGYWGADYPMKKAHSPHQPFILVHGAKQGLYIGHHDVDDEEMVQFLVELKPGVRDTLGDVVPAPEATGGEPVRVQLTLQHFTFTPPGKRQRLSPIVLSPYVGDWQAGAECYKRWRASWHRRPCAPAWCAEIQSWQQVQINSIAGEQRCRYNQIVDHAEQCARHGVGTIQLTGWTRNGQDGWLPSHDSDERLGTMDELKKAIARCRDLGVRIVLYAKFVYGDASTPEYRRELHRYMSVDRNGNVTGHAGWAYYLPSHFAEVNMRRLNWACMQHPGWRDLCIREYERMLSLDSDGILLDETCHPRGDGRYCFASDHGHEVPSLNCRGDRVLLKELNRLAANQPREQLISCEAAHDKNTLDYGLSYERIFQGHVPLLRYIDPYFPILVGVWGYDDREKINMCLMYRYLIEYEPQNFKGHLEDFPLTIEYGKKVDAFRRRYRAELWDAVFRGRLGATVRVKDRPYEDYSVFEKVGTGEKTVVIANHGGAPVVAEIELAGRAGSLSTATPEDPERTVATAAIEIPPRSIVAVFQE